MVLPKTLTVVIDTREQRPLLFPNTLRWYPLARRRSNAHVFTIKRETARLDNGDYVIRGHEESVVVERKGSIRELSGNLLTSDFKRAWAAFSRLGNHRGRILLLDFHPASCLNPTTHVPTPDRVMDALYDVANRLNLQILWTGDSRSTSTRVRVGEQVLRAMLSHCFKGE